MRKEGAELRTGNKMPRVQGRSPTRGDDQSIDPRFEQLIIVTGLKSISGRVVFIIMLPLISCASDRSSLSSKPWKLSPWPGQQYPPTQRPLHLQK